MLVTGSHRVIGASFDSGSTFSKIVNTGGWPRIAIEVPGFTAALSTQSANVFVQVALNSGDTFRNLKDMGVYSAASGIEDWEVPRTIGNWTTLCRPAGGFNYLRLYVAQGTTFNATCTAGMAAKIHLLP